MNLPEVIDACAGRDRAVLEGIVVSQRLKDNGCIEVSIRDPIYGDSVIGLLSTEAAKLKVGAKVNVIIEPRR